MRRKTTKGQPKARRRAGREPRRRAASYHHGALREALLAAAEELLLEQGVDRFTLRECARRAGVSHAAPAHHFGDVQGLLTAFATLGFERLVALARRYREAAPPDPGAQLAAVGQAYLDFAVANRAHFQLMFRNDRLARDDASLQAAGMAAFEQLRETLVAFLRAHDRGETDLPARLLLAWSVVHGLAALLLENRLDAFRGGQPLPAYARTVGPTVLGLLAAALLSDPPAAGPGGPLGWTPPAGAGIVRDANDK